MIDGRSGPEGAPLFVCGRLLAVTEVNRGRYGPYAARVPFLLGAPGVLIALRVPMSHTTTFGYRGG